MPDYRYVGTVAREVQIEERSVPLAPGDFVTMTKKEYEYATEQGLSFIEVGGGDKK